MGGNASGRLRGALVLSTGLHQDWRMPELPEVEVTRRFLQPALEGRVIEEVEIRRERTARRNSGTAEVEQRLAGRRLDRLGRRGKFLEGDLDSGDVMVIHLGMSGRMSLAAKGDPEDPHTNALLRVRGGGEVRFVDPRTFGFIGVFEASPARLGPDALDALPGERWFAERLGGTGRAIKTVLLDQTFVAGLGNIYADEVLWRAGVRPDRSARSLDAGESARIRNAIGPVLRQAIEAGGTSLDDLAYLLPDGRAGENLSRLEAYGREDLPCSRCGAAIRREVIGGRSAFSCPHCQR